MKKLIAALFAIALCAPSVIAEDQHNVYSASNGTFSTTYSTPTASHCDLAYIIVETSGSVAGGTLTVRDGATVKFTVSIGTAAGTEQINLTETPVYFGTNLNVVASVIDGGISYTVVYNKKN